MPNNIVKYEQLKEIVEYSWTKTKDRYDDAFINAEIPTGAKKITFTKRKTGETKEVSLADYARLQDRNKFEQDVSVNDAGFYNNSSLGRIDGTVDSSHRTLGARNLTSKMFTDGFISTLRIYLDNSHTGDSFSVHLWEIKKGANKEADRTISKFKSGDSFAVKQVDGQKYVDIPINKEYPDDTYFLFRSGNTAMVKAIRNIPTDKADDVMNLVDTTPPPTGTDQSLNLSDQRVNETAYVAIFGRIGIKDLNSKINQLQSETTDIGGSNQYAGKIVKLDGQGKLSESMLPTIAINEYIEVDTFDHATLLNKRYENGDVIVVTSSGQVVKRYLCIKKDKNPDDLREGFVELNSKDGIITSINGYRPEADGNIVVTATQDGTGITMAFGSSGGRPVTVATYMTQAEVNEIKGLFT
jgi:hypothetical protein